MPGKTLRAFWSKKAPTGTAVKPPIKSKKLLAALAKQKALGTMELQTLVDALNTYQNIDPANDPTCSQRMTALAAIDAECNKWFRGTAVKSLKDQPGAKEMAKLLKKAEQAHEQLVDATKDDANVVPFDTSKLTATEINDRKAVWRGIVDGTAQVSVGGSEKFQKKTNAQIAKMLQGKTGYDILNYLSTPKGVNPGPNDRIVLADKVPNDLKTNQNLMANDREVSYALELDDTAPKALKQGVPVVGDEDPTEYPTLARTADLQQAIFSGAKGVIVNGKKYEFGGGTGSFVKTVPPHSGDEDSDTAGHGNTEIITPGFVTLAHELGHAVNIRAGAATRDHPELMQALCKAEDPTLTDQRIEDLWSNGEEYFNISNVENGMRRDHGLPLRVAHKPRTALMKIELVNDLGKQAVALMKKDDAVSKIPEYEEAMKFFDANKGKTDDDQIYKQIVKHLQRLGTTLTDNKIEAWKRNDLTEYRKPVDEIYKQKSGALQPTDPMVVEYQAIDNDLKNNLGALAKLGTPDWQNIKDRMRNLRFALAKVA